MKRKTLALTLILALLFSPVVGTQLIFLANANPSLEPTNPTITIESPTNSSYNVNTLTLNVTITTMKTMFEGTNIAQSTVRLITYNVDGKNRQIIDNTTLRSQAPFAIGYNTFVGSVSLSKLTEGAHYLTVRAEYDYNPYGIHRESESTVHFTIDHVSPYISLLAPQSNAHNPTEVALKFFIDEPASWLGYSLDGHDNVTVAGNTTLSGLPSGNHELTVYAMDEAGNLGVSETIYFSVEVPEVPEPQPETFPVVPVAAASVAAIALVSVGLLVYFKKRKH